jgi:RNA polymerase sigma factor (sigma-70 family)
MAEIREQRKINPVTEKTFAVAEKGLSEPVTNDLTLWQQYLQGDESAFISIYKKYFNTLLNFGLQFLGDNSEVEDFVQDLFVDLRLKQHKLKPLKSSLKVYLIICLKNRILDHKRRESTRLRNFRDYSEDFGFAFPLETELIRTQEYAEKIGKLQKALKQLTTRQREAIYYLYYEQLSYSEIAEIMQMSNVKSVRNLVYKGFDSLRPLVRILAPLVLTWISGLI